MLALLEGQQMDEHQAPGPATLQVLRGDVTVRSDDSELSVREAIRLYGSVYRGVALQPPDGASLPTAPAPRAEADDGVRWREAVDVPASAAHVYTECARIWNPIHTDLAVAQRAGLDTPILHGTATLALAVSRVIARDLGGDPGRVREIRAHFAGMVAMPATITVRGRLGDDHGLAFDAVGPDGAPVLGQGVLLPCDR